MRFATRFARRCSGSVQVGIVLFALSIACSRLAYPPSSATTVDGTYLALRAAKLRCPDDKSACCHRWASDLTSADPPPERAAESIQAAALLCPDLKPRALAALDHEAPAVPEDEASAQLDVAFDLALDPSDHLYWAGAYVDQRAAAGAKLAPGAHTVHVVFHVVSAIDTGDPRLVQVEDARPLTLAAGDSRTLMVVLTREPFRPRLEPFAVHFTVGPRRSSAPGIQREPVRMLMPVAAGARLLTGPLRPAFPSELRGPAPRAALVKICVDELGAVESVTPLLDVHPRLLGAVVDSVRATRYSPLELGGRRTPFCHPLRVDFGG